MPLTRTLLLHTGGSFWLDVVGIQGARSEPLLRWLPGSPSVELGLLPSALLSLPFAGSAWGKRLSYFHLGLSPGGPEPLGGSAQLAVAAATLWYVRAAAQSLPLLRPGATPAPEQPLVVLTGSGIVREEPGPHGLFRYRIASAGAWTDKARQLGRALSRLPVAVIHVLCPAEQAQIVARALVSALPDDVTVRGDELVYRDHVPVRIHPVDSLDEVAEVVDRLGCEPGTSRAAPGRDAAGATVPRLRGQRASRTWACLVTLVLTSWAILAARMAYDQARLGAASRERDRALATSRALAAHVDAWEQLHAGKPGHAVALARAAEELAGRPQEARSALIDLLGLAGGRGGLGRVLPASSMAVVTMAVSPTAPVAAVSDDQGTVELWDLATGRHSLLLAEPLGRPMLLGYTPDGQRLIAAPSRPGEMDRPERDIMYFWGGTGRALLATLQGAHVVAMSRPSERWQVFCSQDGLHIVDLGAPESQRTIALPGCRSPSLAGDMAAAASPDRVEVWRLGGEAPVSMLALAPSEMARVALSPDGRFVAVGTQSRLEVWDVTHRARVLAEPVPALWHIVFSPNGSRMVTRGYRDTEPILWDATRWQRLAQLDGHEARHAVAPVFSADGRLLATGTYDGTVRLWQARDGVMLASFSGHEGHIHALGFVTLAGEPWLVSAASDGTLRLWPGVTSALGLEAVLTPPLEYRDNQSLSHDGERLAAATADGAVRQWRRRDSELLLDIPARGEPVAHLVQASPELVVTASTTSVIRGWQPGASEPAWEATLSPRRPLENRWPWISSLSPDRQMLALLTLGGRELVVFDLGTHEQRCDVPLPHSANGPLAFVDRSRVLVARFSGTPGSGRLMVVDVDSCATQLLPGRHERPISSLAISADGAVAVSGSFDGTARIWALSRMSEHCALVGHDREVRDVALSPDGTLVATASWDTTARVWDAATCTTRAIMRGHGDHVQMVVFSHDGSLLATGSKDSTVRLWRVATGELMAVFRGHKGIVVDMAFSADDRLLTSLDYRGTARTWDLAPFLGEKDPVRAAGALSNLRVCTDSLRVVPVLEPWPDPDTVWAPARACGTE